MSDLQSPAAVASARPFEPAMKPVRPFSPGRGSKTIIAIDHSVPLEGGRLGALIGGWVLDPAGELKSLRSTSVDGFVTDIAAAAVRVARLDVVKGYAKQLADTPGLPESEAVWGFICFLPGPFAELTLQAESKEGVEAPIRCPVAESPSTLENLVRFQSLAVKRFLPQLLTTAEPAVWQPLARAMALGATAASVTEHIECECCLQIPDCGVLLSGWRFDTGSSARKLFAYDVQGNVVVVEETRVPRPEVFRTHRDRHQLQDSDLGFVSLMRGLQIAETDERLRLLAISAEGTVTLHEAKVTRWPKPTLRDLEWLLKICVPAASRTLELLEAHIGPAVESIWSRVDRARNPPRCLDFGPQPERPRLTVIVPIYGRWDFIEYQLNLFRLDSDFREHELLYVIDDPTIFDAVLNHSRGLYALWGLSFRIVTCGQNLGYAGANNLAAEVAKGEFLLLLNSDVMPQQAGWTAKLLRDFDELDGVGAIGPRLLFPDDSIQHQGMVFRRSDYLHGLWANTHPGKGLPSDAEVAAPFAAQAVTGACLLTRRSDYNAVGGLDEGYIKGDFEDSDYCLKLRARGLKIYCDPRVSLYHLERQSQMMDGDHVSRNMVTLYNGWRHHRRWDRQISELAGPAGAL